MVSEKDRPILGYLSNIELDLHSEEKGEGYDLIFTFLPNSYFEGTVLKKELHMKDKGILDKSLATKIEWKDGCNPTIKKMKKKKKGKKVNVEVKQDSFFNFFTDIDPENTETKVKPDVVAGGDDDEENEEENDELDKL
jgi:nucleosome assembly protein 1-like 1